MQPVSGGTGIFIQMSVQCSPFWAAGAWALCLRKSCIKKKKKKESLAFQMVKTSRLDRWEIKLQMFCALGGPGFVLIQPRYLAATHWHYQHCTKREPVLTWLRVLSGASKALLKRAGEECSPIPFWQTRSWKSSEMASKIQLHLPTLCIQLFIHLITVPQKPPLCRQL